jgi:hypothetical protein
MSFSSTEKLSQTLFLIKETILTSTLIPANTFSANDILNVVSARFKSGGLGGNIIYKYYVNTSNSLSGASLLGGFNQTTSASTTSKIANKSCFIASGNIEAFTTVSSATNIDSGQFSTGLTSYTFNVAVAQYFIVTATLGFSNTNNARQVELLITN